MFNHSLASTAIAALSLFGCAKGEAMSPSSTKPKSPPPIAADPVFVKSYVYDIGKKLDCYFTFEKQGASATYSSPLNGAEIVPEDVETIDALVAKLNEEVNGVTATRSVNNSKVIHLIEDPLLEFDDYALDKTVSLQYSGTLNNMIEELSQSIPEIGTLTKMGIPQTQLVDYSTQTTLSVGNMQVRDLLVKAVTLEGYHRILWQSETYIWGDNQSRIEIAYTGPASK